MVRRWWFWVVVILLVCGATIFLPRGDKEPDPYEAAERAVRATQPAAPKADGTTATDAKPASYWTMIEERARLDNGVWSTEVLAQKYEGAFIELWDVLRRHERKFDVLGNFSFDSILVGSAGKRESLDWEIDRTRYDKEPQSYTPAQFRDGIVGLLQQGYRLVEAEFHHSEFDSPQAGRPARSLVSFVLHVYNERRPHRVIVRGKLKVQWSDSTSASGNYIPSAIDATEVVVIDRARPASFEPMLKVEPPMPLSLPVMCEPIVLADLDDDGLTDIIVGGRNLLFRNQGQGKFEQQEFSPHLPPIRNTAVLADLMGDGHADFAYVDHRDNGLYLLPGGAKGAFTQQPVKAFAGPCEFPTVITAGDVDEDGDLDLFVGQYKAPYQGGQMPTPYYDANDGLPAYLLQNDGAGKFNDVTEGAGLGKKRRRRTYAASFVDLNGDQHQDLLVTSDFAGVDIHQGDGRGKFQDVTDRTVSERHNFGMSHTLADYDLDGRLDFYVIGMSSTTARRLDYMRLVRDDRADVHKMRARMGYGNRMYLGQGEKFVQPQWNQDVARTGWSWGSTSFDFDRDGDRDIFVANGHQSGRSARDYCTRFWCHDIYTGSSQTNTEVLRLFGATMGELHTGEHSWNGFEHDALLMNLGGKGFVDVAFLFGVGFESDSRSAVSEDLDHDGRPELLVVQNEALYGRAHDGRGVQILRQTLHVLANQFETADLQHWIGVRLRPGKLGSNPPIGAHVTVRTGKKTQIARVVTGDSLYCQHAPNFVFGLGPLDKVDAIDVRWPNGMTSRIARPAVDQYHDARPQ